MRLSGGGAVQHRRAVHQADTLGGMAINGARTAIALVVIGAYLAVIRHPLRFNRWVAVGALEHLRHQRPVLRGQQADHGGQRDRPPVHRPIFVILFSALFWKKARPAGSAGLRDRVRRGALLLCGQPGDGRRPGQCAGPAVRRGLRGRFPDERVAGLRRHLLRVLGDVLSAVTGLPFLLGRPNWSPSP